MRTIVCRKCGAVIDAALGECPNCGAVYYILPEDEKPEGVAPERKDLGSELASASKDDIFATGVWRTFEDPDATRPFSPAPENPEGERPPITRARYQTQPQPQARRTPPRREAPSGAGGRKNSPPHGKNGMSVEKKRMLVAAIALLAVLTLVISIMSGAFDFNKNEKLLMDNVVGMDVTTATGVLENMGLEVITMTEHSEQAVGTVLKQSLKEGKVIKPGDKVTLTVSSGPDENTSQDIEYLPVPSLEGKVYDQALYEVTNLGLVLTRGEEKYSDKAEGTILSQSPAAGTELRKGDIITVVVSIGPEPAPTWNIAVTAGAGGTVSPKGMVSVDENGDVTFTITPDSGYEVGEVKVDGKSVGQVTTYTFENVTEDHSLYVVFRVKTETPSPTPSQTPETSVPSTETPEAPVE